jgi:hypothetical protein
MSEPRSRVAPIAAGRFVLQLTMGQSARDKLRYLQELLSHEMAPSDVAGAVERAFDLAIAVLEKRKFAATARPRRAPRPTESRRHVPAQVKRAVWERDQGRCTFTSESGRRCTARTRLE